MSLNTILEEININRPQANLDLQIGNAQTYGGRLGLKRAATEAMKRLTLDYRKELMESTVFIIVTGSLKETFSELAASEEFGCFSADPEAFYKDIASRIDPSLFGRESAGNLFNIASNILYDKCMELDMGSYLDIQFSEKYNSAVNSPEDFVQLIKAAVNDRTGSEVVGLNAIYSIVDSAIERNHAAPITPVVLSTSDEKFALDLAKNLKKHTLVDGTGRGLTRNVFLVVAGKASKEIQKTPGAVLLKTATTESVGEALTTIRNNVR